MENQMTTGQTGINLIESFESCSLTSYLDIKGILTIGWGHTGNDVYDGETITQDQADELFKRDLIRFEQGICKLVTVDINQNEFDALVCFSYNVGMGNLASSTLLKLLNQSLFDQVPAQFLRWNKAGGVEVPGLTRRRQAEADLFSTPVN